MYAKIKLIQVSEQSIIWGGQSNMNNETNHKQRNNLTKRILTTAGAGIVGSMLTLGVVFNTNLLPEAALQSETPVESSANVSTMPLAENVALADMVEHASSAIVGVVNYQNVGNRFAEDVKSVKQGTGSGVVYKIDGDDAYIVTNNHVIEGAQKIDIVLESGDTATAELIGQDALTDLAVLLIDAKHAKNALTFGDSDALRAGDPVTAIGNPLGLDFSGSVTQGIVSAKNRSINVNTSAGEWALNVIQTDAAINPGNSGGALLNSAGEIIGINSLKIAQGGVEGLGFAIPSNDVIPLIEEMETNKKIERPYIGIGMANLNEVPAEFIQQLPESVQGGVIIAHVDPDSAAQQAGLQKEDIITEINGTEIHNATALRKMLYTELKIGDKVELTIYRGAEKREVTLTLTKK